MNTPANFTPSSLQEKVQERIRASFVDLIPEEAWEKMVQAEIERFTCKQHNGYSGVYESPIEAMIRATIQERLKETLKKYLDESVQTEWDAKLKARVPSAFVKELTESMAPTLIKGVFGMVIQNAVEAIRDELSGR